MLKQKLIFFVGIFLWMPIQAAHWLVPVVGLSGLWCSLKKTASDSRVFELIPQYPSITEYSLSKEDQKNLRPGLKVCKSSPRTGEEYKDPSKFLSVVHCFSSTSDYHNARQKINFGSTDRNLDANTRLQIEVVDHMCNYLDAIDDLHKARWDFYRHLQRPYLLAFKKYGANFLKNFASSDQQVDDFIVPNPNKGYKIAMKDYSDKYEAVCKTEENLKKSVFQKTHISGTLKTRQAPPAGFIEPTGDFNTDRQRFKDMVATRKTWLCLIGRIKMF